MYVVFLPATVHDSSYCAQRYIGCDSLITQALAATEVAVNCKCHSNKRVKRVYESQKLMFLFSHSSHVPLARSHPSHCLAFISS